MYRNAMVIFGGADNEEQAARKVAREKGCVTATATVGGKKVASFNAYKADGFHVDEGNLARVERVFIFECSPSAAGDLRVTAICDHHKPGDPGWGKGADQYWEASSLGQLCAILGVQCTHELEMVAAGDHCPADAYAGRCEGIDPSEFLDFRILGTAVFYANHPKLSSKSVEEIRADIESAKKKLAVAPVVDGVRDLRGVGKIDELPEAALSIGEAYMASLPDTDRDHNPTGNVKIVLGGHTTPKVVERFMKWGNSLPNRVGKAYGNPIRGFAGVVVKPE